MEFRRIAPIESPILTRTIVLFIGIVQTIYRKQRQITNLAWKSEEVEITKNHSPSSPSQSHDFGMQR